jgi:hypothetical protein
MLKGGARNASHHHVTEYTVAFISKGFDLTWPSFYTG